MILVVVFHVLTDVAHACGLDGATLGGRAFFETAGKFWEDDAPRVFIAAVVAVVDVIVIAEVVALASRGGNAQRRRRAAGPVRFCECSRTAARRG